MATEQNSSTAPAPRGWVPDYASSLVGPLHWIADGNYFGDVVDVIFGDDFGDSTSMELYTLLCDESLMARFDVRSRTRIVTARYWIVGSWQ